MLELRCGAPDPEPAQGGRFAELLRDTPVELDGRLELPKPCGARPESVALPCALQARVELPERAPGCAADEGRLAESCDWRLALIPRVESVDIERATVELEPCPAPRAEEFIVRAGE